MRKKKKILALLMTLIMGSSVLPNMKAFAEDTTYLTYYSNVGFNTPGSLNTQGKSNNVSASNVVSYDANGLVLTPSSATQAGSAFLNKKIKQSDGFSTYFNFTLSGRVSAYGLDSGADGLVFIVAKNTNGLGSQGEGIGYTGIANSVGIEFDSFPNGNDISDSHIGINLNGQLTSDKNQVGYQNNVVNLGTGYFNQDGPFHVWIDYENSSKQLSIYISKTSTRPTSPSLSKTIDLSQYCGDEYYVGFTSATGACYEQHKIGKWYFKNDYVAESLNASGTNYDMDTLSPTQPTLTKDNKIVTLGGSTDDKSGVHHYEYQLNSTSGVWQKANTVDISGYNSVTLNARAVDGVGNISSVYSKTYTLEAPDRPTNVHATPADGEAIIQFTPPINDGGSPITGYTVTTSPGGIIALGTDSPIRVAGLNNGTPYDFSVMATNSIGNSPSSQVSNTVVPLEAGILDIETSNIRPIAGEASLVTLTVKNKSGVTETSINGPQDVIISGEELAPGGTIGSFDGTDFKSPALHLEQIFSLNFINGVGMGNLILHKADPQTLIFNFKNSNISATNSLNLFTEHASPAALSVTQALKAPLSNGLNFSTQPVVSTIDAFGNICFKDNATVVIAAKEDQGLWSLSGGVSKVASGGSVVFTDLGASNSAFVSQAKLNFSSAGLTKVDSLTFDLPAPLNNGSGSSKGTSAVISGGVVSAPVSNEAAVIVVVNGKQQNAGIETRTTESGKSVVTVDVNKQVIESKIDEAVKNNTTGSENIIQIPVADTQSEVVKVALTGDIIKKLESNTFNVSVKRSDIEYIIPAKEFTISSVAKNLGVSDKELKDIKVEIDITTIDQATVNKYNASAENSGSTLLYRPTQFDVIAKTEKADGTKGEVAISKFNQYVERIIEIPAGVDPSQITTGIVFNADGTYSHVPTEVFAKENKYYARLNSLTNSDYSIIWHPVTVKSVSNHWSKNAVNDMASRLVVFNPESFSPDKAITRADFAEYIVRALGLYREGGSHDNSFKDVFANSERALSIAIASEYGIVSGYSDGNFKPNALISREEAMTMYQKAMTITALKGTELGKFQSFKDFSQVSSWAAPYVKDVVAAKVFNGKTKTNLSPKENLTYAEAAQAIKNLLVASGLINQ